MKGITMSLLQVLGTFHAVSLPGSMRNEIRKEELLDAINHEGSRVAKALRDTNRCGFVASVRRHSKPRSLLSLPGDWKGSTLHLQEVWRDDKGVLHLGSDGIVYAAGGGKQYVRAQLGKYDLDRLDLLLRSIQALEYC